MNAFLTVFGSRYKTDIVGEQWTTITASYKDDSAKKNFRSIRKKIKNAVNIYNKIYGTSTHKLAYGKYSINGERKETVDRADLVEIDVLQGNTSQKWSEAYALSTSTSQDGYSACLLSVDESILIDAKEFFRSISPFGLANSACTICTGIASTDSSCLQYAVHYNDETYKSIYTWEDIYRLKKATSIKDAEKYKVSVLAEIQKNGGKFSTEVQTNFYMSWEITDGKFTTREQLRKNNVFQTDIEQANLKADFIVAGLDLATTNDYMVLTIMEAYKLDNVLYNPISKNGGARYDYYVKDIITFNPGRERMDVERESKRITNKLREHRVDMVTVDASGTQKAQVQSIYKAVKKANINTLIIPFDFGGYANKAKMMSELELSMFSGRLKLPKEEIKDYHQSFRFLYDELLFLKKYKPKKGRNIKYEAPNGKTDDHVMSLSLGVYTIAYVEELMYKRKMIEIGLAQIIPKLNKYFTEDKKHKPKITSWLGFY